tara:strand:+ start:2113 stop:2502 length:390 start_codon:yes stop_codon:yes gene_type:complete
MARVSFATKEQWAINQNIDIDKKRKTITKTENTYEGFDGPIKSILISVKHLIDTYGEEAYITSTHVTNYGESYEIFEVVYEIEETNKEVIERLWNEKVVKERKKREKKIVEKQDRREYERLKKKFEKGD